MDNQKDAQAHWLSFLQAFPGEDYSDMEHHSCQCPSAESLEFVLGTFLGQNDSWAQSLLEAHLNRVS